MSVFVKIIVSLFFSGMLFIGAWDLSDRDIPKNGFWAMEGEIYTHPFNDPSDSLSGDEIFELRDSDDLTVWFSRFVFKDVCISGECKMIKLWVFWDGAGNYLGIQPPESEPLTKSNHEIFSQDDYSKLDEILNDTASMLKTLNQEDLIIMPEGIDLYEVYKVDGFTAATLPTLAEAVVENAVYTCYTLWHTVYGPVRDNILDIISARMNSQYLEKMLNSGNPSYVNSAIQHIKKDPKFDVVFRHNIIALMESDDIKIADLALDYFSPTILETENLQLELIDVMKRSDISFCYKVLWKFMELSEIHDQTAIRLVKMFSNSKEDVAFLNMTLKLISADQFKRNPELSEIVLSLENSEIYPIRNSCNRFMSKLEKEGI